MEAPLTLDEMCATVRGRHKWNIKEKAWGVSYRKMRDYWIILLLTANEKLFAMPIPKIIPTRIYAQYEEEERRLLEAHKLKFSFGSETGGFSGTKTGIEKKYL